MILRILLLTTLILNHFSPQANAQAPSGNDGKAGNGGISVVIKHPDGKLEYQPIEMYEVNNREKMDICDPQIEDKKAWVQALNKSVNAVYDISPVVGETLIYVLRNTPFYFLDLPEGASFVFTGDAQTPVPNSSLANDAVRMGGDIKSAAYLSKSVWKDWEERSKAKGENKSGYYHPFQPQLTRIFHEALIPYYNRQNKRNLGRAVVRLLELGGVYPKSTIDPEFVEIVHSADIESMMDKLGFWSQPGFNVAIHPKNQAYVKPFGGILNTNFIIPTYLGSTLEMEKFDSRTMSEVEWKKFRAELFAWELKAHQQNVLAWGGHRNLEVNNTNIATEIVFGDLEHLDTWIKRYEGIDIIYSFKSYGDSHTYYKYPSPLARLKEWRAYLTNPDLHRVCAGE